MNWTKLSGAAGCAVLFLMYADPACAQATRTWVSGVGDDANPCSRTAPCKTFAGAISKTAAGGEISILDPGGFGTVTITKSITIDGGGIVGSILAAGGVNGIVINAGAADVVTLRNLSINGAGKSASPGLNGIRFLSGGTLNVENVVILGFSNNGIDFAASGNSKLFASRVDIHEALGVGVQVHPGAGATVNAALDNVRINDSGTGVRVNAGGRLSVTDSVIAGNAVNGVEANSTTAVASINLDRTLVSGNQTGIVGDGVSGTVRISDVGIFDNAIGILATAGGSVFTYGSSRNAGNTTAGTPGAQVTNAIPVGTTSTAFKQ